MIEKSIDEIYKVADKELVDMALELFDNSKQAEKWFFTASKALGGITPYSCCSMGDQKKVEAVIYRLEHGIFS